jgi:hypothetical protein|tara:strand:+ start:47 stop:463 length:417 start_codon:yes stop_codon:yes gene_type:complete
LTQIIIEQQVVVIGLKEGVLMATHNWCHNPKCHTYKTTDRVRGSGNNKVLRTRKVKINTGNYAWYNSIFDYFCNQGCLMAFLSQFVNEVVAINPVHEPSETPIKVEKEKVQTRRFDWSRQEFYKDTLTRTKIIGERHE